MIQARIAFHFEQAGRSEEEDPYWVGGSEQRINAASLSQSVFQGTILTNYPALAWLCQRGMGCILQFGNSHGDLINVRECLLRYLGFALALVGNFIWIALFGL